MTIDAACKTKDGRKALLYGLCFACCTWLRNRRGNTGKPSARDLEALRMHFESIRRVGGGHQR